LLLPYHGRWQWDNWWTRIGLVDCIPQQIVRLHTRPPCGVDQLKKHSHLKPHFSEFSLLDYSSCLLQVLTFRLISVSYFQSGRECEHFLRMNVAVYQCNSISSCVIWCSCILCRILCFAACVPFCWNQTILMLMWLALALVVGSMCRLKQGLHFYFANVSQICGD
jgi:hypothetical protein